MILVLVDHDRGEPDELSLQAITFARRYAEAAGAPLHAVAVGPEAAGAAGAAGECGAATLHLAEHERLDGYAPDAGARAVLDVMERESPAAVVAPGSDHGNEVLARVAARADLAFAANCTEAAPGDPAPVTRLRWGGSLLEEALLHGATKLLTAAPHAIAAEGAGGGAAAVERFTPVLTDADLAVRVVDRVEAVTSGGVSLTDAKVVVSGGRGVGSAEAFAIVEELAGLLGGAVGCSRAVTSAGWRPHTDQVGQTGTKVSPDVYIACGISGATQHMAGCKGAKKIVAINSDREAPIFASADYAVIGDLHQILPAVIAAVKAAKGGAP
jgi:electron transfer flavoprotein alpha subunit